jgi:plastocyanin
LKWTLPWRQFAAGLGGLAALCVCASPGPLEAQATAAAVTAEVSVEKPVPAGHQRGAAANRADESQVVIWLTPLDAPAAKDAVAPASAGNTPELVQRNKSFEPHVIVVQVGSLIRFPNKDPFFHNIFSMYDGKRFDLGLYEAGTSRSVRFDRPGVSFLFCNIHAEMSAVVIVVDTPYFAMSDRTGHLTIPDVPDGRYQMHVWYERSLPENLKELTRVVTVSEKSRSLGAIHVVDNPNFTLAHKNKYGEDYVPPPTEGYQHP